MNMKKVIKVVEFPLNEDGSINWAMRVEDGLETHSLTENDEADAIVKQMKKFYPLS